MGVVNWLGSLFSGGRSATSNTNFGAPTDKTIPHVLTFANILGQVYKAYSHRYDEALRHFPQNALAMRRDAYLQSLLQERYLPTARRKWQLEVDDDKDKNQKIVKEGLTRCVRATKKFARMRRYLMEATWYGRYGSQGMWTRDKDSKDDAGNPLWCFRNHQPVNGDKIQFTWDGTPAVMVNTSAQWPADSLMYTERAPALKLDRPEWRRQFIVHTHDVEDADYFEGEMAGAIHGIGIRSRIYWSWWMRDELLSWSMDFMQKVGTLGLLVFWYEEGNKGAKEKAEANAKNASNRSAITLPRIAGKDGTSNGVEQIAPSTGGVEALQGMIADYFERHQERLIVGQSMSSGGRDTQSLGGTGRADFAADTKYQILAYDAENLDETLTDDFVQVAKTLNYPWADFPVRFKSIVPDPEKESRLKGLTTIWDRVPVRMADVYEAADAVQPEEDDEVVEAGNDQEHEQNMEEKQVADRPPGDKDNDDSKEWEGILTYAWDESKHPRGQPDNAGQFGPGGGTSDGGQPKPDKPKHGDRVSQLKQQRESYQTARREVFESLRADAEASLELSKDSGRGAKDVFDNMVYFEPTGDFEKFKAFNESMNTLDDLLIDIVHGELTPAEAHRQMGEALEAAKEAMKAHRKVKPFKDDDDMEVSADDLKDNGHKFEKIILHIKNARESLRTYATHRREMRTIKEGGDWE